MLSSIAWLLLGSSTETSLAEMQVMRSIGRQRCLAALLFLSLAVSLGCATKECAHRALGRIEWLSKSLDTNFCEKAPWCLGPSGCLELYLLPRSPGPSVWCLVRERGATISSLLTRLRPLVGSLKAWGKVRAVTATRIDGKTSRSCLDCPEFESRIGNIRLVELRAVTIEADITTGPTRFERGVYVYSLGGELNGFYAFPKPPSLQEIIRNAQTLGATFDKILLLLAADCGRGRECCYKLALATRTDQSLTVPFYSLVVLLKDGEQKDSVLVAGDVIPTGWWHGIDAVKFTFAAEAYGGLLATALSGYHIFIDHKSGTASETLDIDWKKVWSSHQGHWLTRASKLARFRPTIIFYPPRTERCRFRTLGNRAAEHLE